MHRDPPLLSRVADAVHWMNRYVERAENVARFVDVNLHLMLDLPWAAAEPQWGALIATSGDTELYQERYGRPNQADVLRFLTFDAKYPSSILSCLRAARENARSVREIISSEMWEHLNKTYLTVKDAARDPDRVLAAPAEFYAQLKTDSHTYVGITYLTMTHNEAWHFGRMGRLLERADKTSRIVDVKCFLLMSSAIDQSLAIDEIQWGALLKSASALEMYKKRFGRIRPEHVVDFLLLDPKFPRSVRYSVVKAERSLRAITGAMSSAGGTDAEKRLASVRAELELADVGAILKSGLHEHLDALQTKLNGVGNAMHDTFFSPPLRAAPALV